MGFKRIMENKLCYTIGKKMENNTNFNSRNIINAQIAVMNFPLVMHFYTKQNKNLKKVEFL